MKCYFGINTLALVNAMRKILGRCEDDLRLGDISGIKVDPAAHSLAACEREPRFNAIRKMFHAWEHAGIDQSLEENELTEDAGTHLFAIIICEIPPYNFTLIIDWAVFCAEKLGAGIEKSDVG